MCGWRSKESWTPREGGPRSSDPELYEMCSNARTGKAEIEGVLWWEDRLQNKAVRPSCVVLGSVISLLYLHHCLPPTSL